LNGVNVLFLEMLVLFKLNSELPSVESDHEPEETGLYVRFLAEEYLPGNGPGIGL